MESVTVNLREDGETQFLNKDNVGKVEILTSNRVMLFLSRNALIGLGEHLIRMAHRDYQNGYHVHVDPCEKGYLPQAMGFFSQPDSAELIICCSEFEGIEKYIK
jgi:hypothetical protein